MTWEIPDDKPIMDQPLMDETARYNEADRKVMIEIIRSFRANY